MRKTLLILLLSPIYLWAQPGNYWTNSFNSEASILSGAVVGGNAGITAIFYNPAGISEVEQSRVDLNASLFNLEYKKYKNPLGSNTQMDNWNFAVFPRFVSYLYPSKKYSNMTYQVAIFNRNSAKTSIYNRVQKTDTQLGNHLGQEEYTGLFDLSSEYEDYWGCFGISKKLNHHWSIGVSINVSIQSLNYLRSANANVLPQGLPNTDSSLTVSSNWQQYEKIKAYNWRVIGKIGVLYKKNRWSAGMNLTLPSLRLFGDADVNKTVSQTNIYFEDHYLPDYYKNEYPQYVYFKMQDPLSISIGGRYKAKRFKSEIYFTLEYFAAIKEYLSIDPKNGVSKNSIEGTDYSAYTFGNRNIINVAIGYKNMITETLGFLAGFRTDFNPYIMGFNEKYWEENSFENLNVNLYHITSGVNFQFHRAAFVVGLQYSTGVKRNQAEFVNYGDPVAYDPETKLALQGPRMNSMTYYYNALGVYLSFSISF